MKTFNEIWYHVWGYTLHSDNPSAYGRAMRALDVAERFRDKLNGLDPYANGGI